MGPSLRCRHFAVVYACISCACASTGLPPDGADTGALATGTGSSTGSSSTGTTGGSTTSPTSGGTTSSSTSSTSGGTTNSSTGSSSSSTTGSSTGTGSMGSSSSSSSTGSSTGTGSTGSTSTGTGTTSTGTTTTGGTLPTQLSGSTCRAFAKPADSGGNVMLTQVFSGLLLNNPTALVQPPGDSNQWFAIELGGRLSAFPNRPDVQESDRVTSLDITASVFEEDESGTLGLAIDPNYASNGNVYMFYTLPQDPCDTNSIEVFSELVRYTVDPVTRVANPNGAIILNQPGYFDYHLGGNVQFGPDGMLYVGLGMGDTDGGDDPLGFAQNLQDWRGKMLRIDVQHTSNGNNYAIPADNPYVAGGGLPEIYAYGFRNPWRWSFDPGTGTLWLGDVGKDTWEEVDQIVPGGNYGWPTYEGNYLNNDPCTTIPGPDTIHNYVPPVYSFDHLGGDYSGACVTGGYVYRGTAIPSLYGQYIFGDCLYGHVWALQVDANGVYHANLLVDNVAGTFSFAEDSTGELYLLARDSNVYRLDPASPNDTAGIPSKLSQTGCVDANNTHQKVSGMLPYTVQVPFWSDGADKSRYLSLPLNGQIHIDPNNHLVLPVDTVVSKDFAVDGNNVETRLWMRFSDGTWGGFSYQWDSDGLDATLVPSTGAQQALSNGTVWHFPSWGQCDMCHNAAAQYTLGWTVAQMNTVGPLTQSNQLNAFAAGNLLDAPLPSPLATLTDPNDATASLDARARAYLQVNCALCHQPGGPGEGGLDLRVTTADNALGVCNVVPSEGTFGLPNAHDLTPQSAADSLMSYRMHNTGGARMPPVSSHVVDPLGTSVVDAWINSLMVCPP